MIPMESEVGRTLELLIVEDSRNDVRWITDSLNRLHYNVNVHHREDGKEGILYLSDPRNKRPDLIFLDLRMPNMDGFEFLEAVKGDEELRPIPVVVLSSSDHPQDIRDAYARHANCYVLKPRRTHIYDEPLSNILQFWSVWNTQPPK